MNWTRIRKSVRSFVFTYLVFVVARNRRTTLAKAISWATLAYQKAIGNCSFDMRLNGERRVLELLATDPSFVLFFDVGANRGDWVRTARTFFPAASIHCFEIALPTFAILKQRLASDKFIVFNDFGLADVAGSLKIDFAPDDDGLTSMLACDGATGSIQIDVNTRVGDEYIESQKILVIDFLKVDVEGAEPYVFAGFERAFENRTIRVVQFEYGHARATLRQFYDLFESRGYVVGKVFPDGCVFDGYRAEREGIASNYIAVRADESKIVSMLTAVGSSS